MRHTSVLLLFAACASWTPETPVAPRDTPVAAAAPTRPPTPPLGRFAELAPGVAWATFELPLPTDVSDGLVRVVRLDPAHIVLRVRTGHDGPPRPLAHWIRATDGAVAAINPAMFHGDGRSVGLLVADDVVNQEHAANQRSWLVAGPRDPAEPRFSLRHGGCPDGLTADTARAGWRTVVQSIRLLGCDGEVVWAPEPRRWSAALVGADDAGRVLFLHVRSPYTMHDLAGALRELPLGLVSLHYGEGGPEATLTVVVEGQPVTWVGSYETGFHEADTNVSPWPLPNALVAVRR